MPPLNRADDSATKMEQHTWRKNLVSAIDRVENATISLLTTEWLRFAIPPSEACAFPRLPDSCSQIYILTPAAAREAELARIRQIFIPDLIFRLHALLTSPSVVSPALLQRALDLSKTVASEQYHVYQEFFGTGSNPNRLVSYLDKIREASLQSLKLGVTPFVVA